MHFNSQKSVIRKTKQNLLFFDLDGTLLDTSERHYRVYKDILSLYKVSNILRKEEFWNRKRNGVKTVELLRRKTSEKLVQKFTEEWFKRIENKKYLSHDNLLQENVDILSTLSNKDNLVLITLRNNKDNLFWQLKSLKLDKYFKEILIASSSSLNSKIFLIKHYLKKCHGNNIDNNIIIGDTEVDIVSGKTTGILTVAVSCGIRSKEFLARLEPDFLLDKFSDLPEVLENLN